MCRTLLFPIAWRVCVCVSVCNMRQRACICDVVMLLCRHKCHKWLSAYLNGCAFDSISEVFFVQHFNAVMHHLSFVGIFPPSKSLSLFLAVPQTKIISTASSLQRWTKRERRGKRPHICRSFQIANLFIVIQITLDSLVWDTENVIIDSCVSQSPQLHF